MLFGVLYAVFSQVLQVGDGVKRFPVALLLGIVLYGFFNGVTSGGVKSLVQREPLVRKVEFPRLAVPLATTIAGVLDVVLNLIPVLVFLLFAGGRWHQSWLQVPVLLVLLVLFAFGLAMLLSALFVRYRDIDPIWDVMLQLLFYASWIFFPLDTIIRDHKVSETVVRLTLANPLAAILQQMRHAFIDPSYMTTSAAMGGAIWLLLPFGVGLTILLLGYRVFSREAPRVAEDL
jgi:ABC-2 type transport system permease protein